MKTRLGTTTKENKLLRDLLKKNSIAIPRKIPTTTTTDSTSSGTVATDTADDAVAMTTTEVAKLRESLTAAATTMSRPPQVTSQTTVTSNATQPTTATTAVLNHLPISSASVAKEQSKRESIAYVAPFIITTNTVSAASSTASVLTPVTTCPVAQVPATSVAQNNALNNLGQLNQLQGNIGSLSNPNPSFNPPVVQLGNNVPYSVTQQPLQTVSTPVSSASQVMQSQAGYSSHSVAAIMKVAMQPGTSISPISVVNAVPLGAPTTGHNTAAILNLQPAVINSCAVVPSTVQMSTSTPLVAVPVPNSLGNPHTAAGVSSTVVAQSTSLPAFYVTATPNQSITVSKISQAIESASRPKVSADASKNQGSCKTKKTGPANKGQKKSGVNTSRTQNTNRNSQNKPLSENKATSASNKRGGAHLTVRDNTRMAKRASTCSSQDPPGNMSICQPQPEIMTIQTFNVNSLIPGIATQVSVPANTMPTRVDCGKPTVQVSGIGMSQAGQIPRLSHSIASLAGLPQSMEQTQTADLQQHQQVSQLGAGSLSFSAESLLASSEVVLPNIPHITTTSVNSDSNPNQPSSLTMAVAPSIHSTPSEQGHAQSFSNYSAEALIGGNELMGDSVMTQESQLQSRPSRTTYSDFSAESLIGSSDLNSSLSYAIDNLISSRSDANYNSTAMVSVNPNLLHSVKSNATHDASTNNPLRALAAMPDLVEQKATAPSSQSSMLFSGPTPNGAYRMSPPHSAASQFTFVTHNSTRRQTDGITQQQGTAQAVNSTNNVSVPSTSFLKHSVDSITSSFYAVSNAGSSLSLGSNSTPGSAFQGQGSFGLEPFSSSQLSFGSMTNPFSPTRSFFNHGSTMGSFV